jgi:hypothetical protein
VLLAKYYSYDQIDKKKMGGERSMYVEWRGEMRTVFRWGSPRERDHFDVLGVNGKIKLQWIFKMWNFGLDWFDLAQDRGTWQDLVNAVMNLRVS